MTTTTFDSLVRGVVIGLRDLTPRSRMELGVIHGFCVDAATESAPKLVTFLSTAAGLQALLAELSRMPETIIAVGVDGSQWQFVDKT